LKSIEFFNSLLRDFGIMNGDFPEIITKSQAACFMRGNPIVLDSKVLRHILESDYEKLKNNTINY